MAGDETRIVAGAGALRVARVVRQAGVTELDLRRDEQDLARRLRDLRSEMAPTRRAHGPCFPGSCLILLDLSMPVMDGASFRREQQRDPALSRAPVVLYSGVADPARDAAALGAPHYFKRPLDLDKLVTLVASHC